MRKYNYCSALLVILVLLLGATPYTAIAGAKEDARKALESSISSILKTLNEADLNQTKEHSPVVAKLEKQVLDVFSLDQFSMRTVGKKWRSFTPKQKEDFKAGVGQDLRSTLTTTG